MDNNPLFEIAKQATFLKDSIESGNFENINPEIKKAMESMTEEQKAMFKKQARENVDIVSGLKRVNEAMEQLKQTSKAL